MVPETFLWLDQSSSIPTQIKTISHFNNSLEPNHPIVIIPSKRPMSLGLSYGYLLAYLRLNLRMTTQLIEEPANGGRNGVVTCYDECPIPVSQLNEVDEGGGLRQLRVNLSLAHLFLRIIGEMRHRWFLMRNYCYWWDIFHIPRTLTMSFSDGSGSLATSTSCFSKIGRDTFVATFLNHFSRTADRIGSRSRRKRIHSGSMRQSARKRSSHVVGHI